MNTRSAWMAVLGILAVQATASADIITGTLQNINAADNKAKLLYIDEQGKSKDVTVKWKEDAQGVQKLESAQPGAQVSLDVKKSMGDWELNQVLSVDQGAQGAQGALKSGASSQSSPGSQAPASR